jgi:hypothetical protein
MDGFKVDLGALEDAAAGVNTVLDDLKAKKVADIGGRKADFGHDDLGDTVADFCSRWEIGVEHLAKDGQEVSDRLTKCVEAYLRVDKNLKCTDAQGTRRDLRPDGVDPGQPGLRDGHRAVDAFLW